MENRRQRYGPGSPIKNQNFVIDVKFDKYGIKYGWAGKQALITVDEWAMKNDEYQEFLKEFKDKALPEKKEDKNLLKIAKKSGFFLLFDLPGLCASFIVDYFKDKAKLKQQLLLYGILNFYENDLETFMNS